MYCMVPEQRHGEMRGSASLDTMWQILQMGPSDLPGSSGTSSMSSAAATEDASATPPFEM